MRVLVTGANGQLGYCLQKTAPARLEVIATERDSLDFTQLILLPQQLAAISPDLIINTAAYTAVDKAETEQELAYTINAKAVAILAQYCEQTDIPFIQVSTDFVFNGEQATPYKPEDKPCPINIYGASKRQGEVEALQHCSRAYIVRTAWVYAEHGTNFVKTMLRLGQERDHLGIVSDQIGTPTYARNLAKMIWRLADVLPEQKIFHFSDAGVASWYDFASAVFNEAKAVGLIVATVKLSPITSAEYQTPAKRPRYSVLDKTDVWRDLVVEPVYWREALNDMLSIMKADNFQ